MDCVDGIRKLIQHLEDLKLLTTDDQLHKADEIWGRLLVLILELEEQNRKSTDVVKHLWSIGLEDITAKYLEYNRPSLQIKVMKFTTVFAIMVYSNNEFKISHRLNNQHSQLMQSPNCQVKIAAMKSCTELYKYKRWSEKDGFDIKPMVEIIVHESDQEMLTLAIGLFSKVCHSIDDENFGIVLSRLVSRLESSNGLVAVGFIENFQTMYWKIHRHNPVKAVECGIIPAVVNTLRSVDQEVISQSIYTIQSFCDYEYCEVISAELIRSGLIQMLSDLCVRYSDNSRLKSRMIEVAGSAASKMRDFPVSLARSLVFEQLTMSVCDVDMGGSLYLFNNISDMIEKSTNKDEMIKVFREYGIVKQLITIYSRRDIRLYDYNGSNTSIVNLLRALVNFADNHSDSSIRTELEQGGIFENLTAIVKSDTADHTNKRVAGQIIETCFQHRVHVASSSIWPYDDNAEIDMKSGMAGYKHGNARTLVEMRYIQYLQSILCKPMWWIDITNQHIVEQWRADSLDRNISPSTFNFALKQLGVFFISRKFQWLPSEFRVEQDGSVTINSYINNLNPIWHRDMYKCIAKIFKCFVPMFESLFRTIHPMFKYIDIHNGIKGYKPPNRSDRGGMESDTQVIRPVYVPTLPEHFQSNYESAKPVSLRGCNLQVIVKLTNIQLTPSKPKYDEGNWHNEGPRNESIVATGLYYYDVENITTPKLDFREAVNRFDQRASGTYWKDVYDINLESPRNQYIGSLEVPNGRCVVYPNRYQHKEQSFELADPTQPGHCKILTFFVVNPSRRIVSTAHVAPQQPQWCNSSLDKAHVPPELWNDITQYIQGVQSPAEAKHYRDELTSDRTRIVKAYNEDIYERVYYLD
ncbi:hypothetical protein BATDEDRAFT_35065 [Batrachochytrium dendrobatidis JAM81]|uniref:DUF4246 domain-containing protein n=1 Tax=Batrachochytrium dendrobatidis (strain JAM81 / FGSC 10211) TaxID=684364 RepID=F4P392_BATDJ|nr:uncharacterized protein BATDEDRAFT_35065 [Batrachochytrium dendrobatidis JAM81]EGF80103.1 hypothetical protein BATDEDRAFT_35065 [Batrachochytrium dendrobatidis JAM81]|eukprot:XP_006679096.1 hypothetical protein BATDEDRAFT_35065 [Batrachochytrium dendrobatidis JAM81]